MRQPTDHHHEVLSATKAVESRPECRRACRLPSVEEPRPGRGAARKIPKVSCTRNQIPTGAGERDGSHQDMELALAEDVARAHDETRWWRPSEADGPERQAHRPPSPRSASPPGSEASSRAASPDPHRPVPRHPRAPSASPGSRWTGPECRHRQPHRQRIRQKGRVPLEGQQGIGECGRSRRSRRRRERANGDPFVESAMGASLDMPHSIGTGRMRRPGRSRLCWPIRGSRAPSSDRRSASPASPGRCGTRRPELWMFTQPLRARPLPTRRCRTSCTQRGPVGLEPAPPAGPAPRRSRAS